MVVLGVLKNVLLLFIFNDAYNFQYRYQNFCIVNQKRVHNFLKYKALVRLFFLLFFEVSFQRNCSDTNSRASLRTKMNSCILRLYFSPFYEIEGTVNGSSGLLIRKTDASSLHILFTAALFITGLLF